MLALTPEVEVIRAWFEATHEIETSGLSAYWRCVRMPDEGSIADQDGWLWDALAVCRRVSNQVLHEQVKKSKPDRG